MRSCHFQSKLEYYSGTFVFDRHSGCIRPFVYVLDLLHERLGMDDATTAGMTGDVGMTRWGDGADNRLPPACRSGGRLDDLLVGVESEL